MQMEKKSSISNPDKFTRVFEDEHSKQTWKYDYTVTRNGPISVEVVYKKNIKNYEDSVNSSRRKKS